MLESIWTRCRALVRNHTWSSLPKAVCFTLFACILGVQLHTRRVCETVAPIAQASPSTGTSTAAGSVEGSMPGTNESPSSPQGLEPRIEFHIGQGTVATIPDGCYMIGATWLDMQLDIELVRREPSSSGEASRGH